MSLPENTTPEHPTAVTEQPVVQPATFFDLLLTILEYKKMIFGTSFAVAVVTAILSLFMSNIYTAKTLILPGDEGKGLMSAMLGQLGGLSNLAGGALGGALGGPTKTDLYITMLKSETVKDQLIDKFKLMEVFEAKKRSNIYRRLDAISKISAGKKDGVITITVDNKDPKLAAELANAYVDALGKLVTDLGMAGAGDNRLFLEKRLAEAKVDVSKAEDNLKRFQTANKAISVPDQVRASFEGIAQLRAQLTLQEIQLGMLQRQFTDNSQEVKTAKAGIASLRRQIATLEGGGNGNNVLPAVGAMPQLGQEYVRLMREFKIQEAVLEMLTKQYELAKISEGKDVSPIQIIQKAKVPDRKSRPARSKIVLATSFIALVGSAYSVFLQKKITDMSEEKKLRWVKLTQCFGLDKLFLKYFGAKA